MDIQTGLVKRAVGLWIDIKGENPAQGLRDTFFRLIDITSCPLIQDVVLNTKEGEKVMTFEEFIERLIK